MDLTAADYARLRITAEQVVAKGRESNSSVVAVLERLLPGRRREEAHDAR